MDREVLKTNLNALFEYARAVEAQTGRRLYIVGATKTRTAEEINLAASLGLEIAGENKAQEFRDKMPLVSSSVQKHFIGHLQANKVKYVVGVASLIHSCDCLQIAEAVSKRAEALGICQDMLIEVNISGEENKHGFAVTEVFDAAKRLKAVKNVRFRGLMTVLPHADEQIVRECCKKMKELFDALRPELGEQFELLSMGMSEDYRIAVSCGANMIRIGRGIFGDRRK